MKKGQKAMLLSIIIPCYNSVDCIEPLLLCLEHQTIGIENLEIIFVDDASTDGTRMRLMEFQNRYPQNVQIIENDKNYGVSYARNRGVEKSRTSLVTFADHDDVPEYTIYETLYKSLMKSGCEIAMCAHDYITHETKIPREGECGCNNKFGRRHSLEQQTEFPPVQIFELTEHTVREMFMMQFRNDLECWSKLIRKSFLLEHNIVFPEGMWGEDFYWWMLVEMNLNSLCWVPSVLYHHTRKSRPSVSKEMHNWMSAQLLLNHEAKSRGLYQYFWEILDLELFEIGFASTLYYRILKNNFSVEELEELRQVVIRETTDILNNTYVRGQNFRYRYSEYALGLLEEEVTAEHIRDFLKSIVVLLG